VLYEPTWKTIVVVAFANLPPRWFFVFIGVALQISVGLLLKYKPNQYFWVDLLRIASFCLATLWILSLLLIEFIIPDGDYITLLDIRDMVSITFLCVSIFAIIAALAFVSLKFKPKLSADEIKKQKMEIERLFQAISAGSPITHADSVDMANLISRKNLAPPVLTVPTFIMSRDESTRSRWVMQESVTGLADIGEVSSEDVEPRRNSNLSCKSDRLVVIGEAPGKRNSLSVNVSVLADSRRTSAASHIIPVIEDSRRGSHIPLDVPGGSSHGDGSGSNKSEIPRHPKARKQSIFGSFMSNMSGGNEVGEGAPRRKSLAESLIERAFGMPDASASSAMSSGNNMYRRESPYRDRRPTGEFSGLGFSVAKRPSDISGDGEGFEMPRNGRINSPTNSHHSIPFTPVDCLEIQELILQSYRVGFIDEPIFQAVNEELKRRDPDGIVLWLFRRAKGNFSKFIKLLKGSVWQALSTVPGDRGVFLSVPNVTVTRTMSFNFGNNSAKSVLDQSVRYEQDGVSDGFGDGNW
jgi:hypothetical protein